eukprot:scaffold18661_cov16-Tisochrysis_lutea.AAC.1
MQGAQNMDRCTVRKRLTSARRRNHWQVQLEGGQEQRGLAATAGAEDISKEEAWQLTLDQKQGVHIKLKCRKGARPAPSSLTNDLLARATPKHHEALAPHWCLSETSGAIASFGFPIMPLGRTYVTFMSANPKLMQDCQAAPSIHVRSPLFKLFLGKRTTTILGVGQPEGRTKENAPILAS